MSIFLVSSGEICVFRLLRSMLLQLHESFEAKLFAPVFVFILNVNFFLHSVFALEVEIVRSQSKFQINLHSVFIACKAHVRMSRQTQQRKANNKANLAESLKRIVEKPFASLSLKLISNYWLNINSILIFHSSSCRLITCANICTNHNRSLAFFYRATIDIAFALVLCLHFSLIVEAFCSPTSTSELLNSRS